MRRIELDTTTIDLTNPEITNELDTDLRRLDQRKPEEAPEEVNAYKVIVTPATQSYRPGLHRFLFEIQYGNIVNNNFLPKGKPEHTQSEGLPMI